MTKSLICTLIAVAISGILLSQTSAEPRLLDLEQVQSAAPGQHLPSTPLSPLIVRTQILLSRAGFSPGQIDGKGGENLQKALDAFADAHKLPRSKRIAKGLFDELQKTSSQVPVLEHYQITDADVAGPFLRRVPAKMDDMKDLPALPYESVQEELAERFHESRSLLLAMNPRAVFQAGQNLVVPNVLGEQITSPVSRIVVDKTRQTVEAFGRHNKLLAFYPATVGSTEKPAPSGTLAITSIRHNPFYRYNPAYHFKGVHSRKPFTIKPGPNNPVGLIWIGLSKKGYGIHGTPEPGKIGKAASHGCVRLTNWDALQLGAAVRKGVKVEFVGDEAHGRWHRTAQSRPRGPV